MAIKLPDLTYKDKLIYHIKASVTLTNDTEFCSDISNDPLIGRYYKFTGDQWNIGWDWIGIEKASLEELEQIYTKIYGNEQ